MYIYYEMHSAIKIILKEDSSSFINSVLGGGYNLKG